MHWTNRLPSSTAKYFKFWIISPEQLLPFFCTPVGVFLCIVESIGLDSMWEAWLLGCNSSLKSRILQTVDRDPLVTASPELMALLDVFRFWREISLLCRTSCCTFSGSVLWPWSGMGVWKQMMGEEWWVITETSLNHVAYRGRRQYRTLNSRYTVILTRLASKSKVADVSNLFWHQLQYLVNKLECYTMYVLAFQKSSHHCEGKVHL